MGLALFITALILRVSIQRTRQLNLAHQTNLFNKRINKSFFTTILNLPLVFFETRSIGDLTTRLNDIQKVQGLIALLFGSVVIEILTTLTTIGVTILYNWQSGLATSISLPFYFLVTIISRQEVNKIQKETIQLNAKSEAFYINSLLGITSIAQLNRQSHFSSKQREVFAALQNKINDLSKIKAKMGFRLGLLNSAFLGTILIILSSQVINNRLSLGEMMAVIGFSSVLGPSIGNLALIIIPFSEAKISFSRMLDLLKTPIYKNNGIALNQIDSINVKHLSFNYPGNNAILKDINFNCSKGSVLLITGKNGSGKSTLFKLLQGNYTPSENSEICFNNDISIKSVNLRSLKNCISVIDQDTHIFNGTLRENLMLALPDKHNQWNMMEDYFIRTGFDHFFKQFSQGYESILGSEGQKISRGQIQIIALARAFIREPQVLLLDEPETGLDNTAIRFILNKLEEIRKKTIIIISTHSTTVQNEFHQNAIHLSLG